MHSFSTRLSSANRSSVASKTVIAAPLKRRSVVRPAAKLSTAVRIRSLPRRSSRSLRCQSEARPSGTARDPALSELQKLLEAASTSPGWLHEVQSKARQLGVYTEDLRVAVTQKSNELGLLEHRLAETTTHLNDARQLQLATAAQLDVRSHEVELLKAELSQLQQHRDADVTSSMERYRELEAALGSVEAELRSQSESLQSKGASQSPVDANKLSEIVHEQDSVFQNLTASLKLASEERQKAEDAAREAKLKAEEVERVQKQLQQDQELLTKELSHLQILYAEKEMEWMNDVQRVTADCDQLKEETVGLEVTLATRDRKLNTLTTALESLKSDFDETETRLKELRRECVELKSVNTALEEQLRGRGMNPDQQTFTHLKSQLTRLQVRVPVLEAEISEMTEEKKKTAQQYEALEKEFRRNERKLAQLEQRAAILQGSMEEKSNRLVAAHKEKRSLKSDADRLQREAAGQKQRLFTAEKEYQRLREQLERKEEEKRELQRLYQQEMLSIAEGHQEAQKVILYHQDHKKENRDLKSVIAGVTQQLENSKAEMQKALAAKAEEISHLQATLADAEEKVKAKEVDIAAAEEACEKLEDKMEALKATSESQAKERATEVAELHQQLQKSKNSAKGAESEMLSLKQEMAKFQNELTQRQRIISVRDQEILTLKDDARLANERVEALRGQITSMQTLNREMEVEMSETDSVVSQMNEQLREMQGDCQEKEKKVTELNKTVSDLEAKGKQSMEQFSSQVESLEEYSKQQEALVESFFEEKQALEASVTDLAAQLKGETEERQNVKQLYEASQKENQALKEALQQAQSDMNTAKATAAAEIEEAAEILAKAESVAQSVQGSLDEVPTMINGAMPQHSAREHPSVPPESDLEPIHHSTATTVEVAQEVDSAVQSELMEMSKRLSQSLAAEEAALTEIQQLRDQVKAMGAATGRQPVTTDERFNDLRRHASRLEDENEKLRKAAAKRNQILAQSRHFIEQYLDRSINSLTDLQP